eukprot:gene34525-biopygen32639
MWWVLRNLGKNDEDYWWLLGARYIPSKADEWARTLTAGGSTSAGSSTLTEEQWGKHSVDRFALEISAQLPRYCSAWHDPGCEGVDSLTYDWRREHNWVNPPWSWLDELPVSCHLRAAGVETEQIKKMIIKEIDEEERYRAPPSETTEEQQQQSREEEEEEEEEKPTPWRTALLQHLTGELGDDNQFSETAAEMQAAALQKLQLKNDR